MTRFSKTLITSLLASLAFGTASHAAMSSVDQALAADHNPRFMIVAIDAIEKHDLAQDYYGSLTPQSPQARDLHAAIDANPMLRHALLAQNVEIKNVVGAERAADGSFVLYMR